MILPEAGSDRRIERHAVVVVGMHRSGTSALARTLSLRGAALPRRILRPAPDNEAGFWEPREIVAIHDELLASAGSSWHDVGEFPRSWFASNSAGRFKERLVDALHEDFGRTSLFVVKDPRICRLVPLWLSVLDEFGASPLFVIPIRHPLEVAASLEQRNGFAIAKSLLLWLRHFLAAERDTRGFRRSFVAYHHLLSDWCGVVDRIGRDLHILWPRRSVAFDLEIDYFLSKNLRHHRFDDERLLSERPIGRGLRTAFDWAMQAVNRQPSASAELDAVSEGLATATTTIWPLVAEGETQSEPEQEIPRPSQLDQGRYAKLEAVPAACNGCDDLCRDGRREIRPAVASPVFGQAGADGNPADLIDTGLRRNR